jgi:Ni,Fe-hydrogenase I cytochrome b subunit
LAKPLFRQALFLGSSFFRMELRGARGTEFSRKKVRFFGVKKAFFFIVFTVFLRFLCGVFEVLTSKRRRISLCAAENKSQGQATSLLLRNP